MLRYAEDERSWSEWMRRAHQGDREAYQCLMTALGGAVEAYLCARFGPVDFLEDCVQECLLAVHRARHTWDPERPFRPWLFTIVRHKAIDLLRRRQLRSREVADSLGVEDLGRARSEDPAAALEGARILERLEPKYAEALTLTKFAGYSVDEAARRTGISQTAMKTRVHRGLRAARKLLESEVLPV